MVYKTTSYFKKSVSPDPRPPTPSSVVKQQLNGADAMIVLCVQDMFDPDGSFPQTPRQTLKCKTSHFKEKYQNSLGTPLRLNQVDEESSIGTDLLVFGPRLFLRSEQTPSCYGGVSLCYRRRVKGG